jgi:hypothetical protein
MWRIAEEFGIFDFSPSVEDNKLELKAYWLVQWLCTDTHVGMVVYFLHDEPVFITTQTARKNGIEYHWVSQEAYFQVKDYVNKINYTSEEDLDALSVMDLEEDVGPTYTVGYSSQLLTTNVIYEPKSCAATVIESWPHDRDISKWSIVKLKLEDGTEVDANLQEEVRIPMLLDNQPTVREFLNG